MNNPAPFANRKKLVVAALTVPIAVFMFALLVYSRKSLDFSDESLYLFLTTNPTPESTLGGVWNWYLNVIFQLSGEDIVHYRQVSVVISFACSYLFAWAYFTSAAKSCSAKVGIQYLYLPIMLTSVSTVFLYRYTLMTPGYNWLALIGVLLSMSGAIKWLHGKHSLVWPAISVLGLGIATMARPTAGIIIFLGMLTYRKIRMDIFRFTAAGKSFFATIISFMLLHHFFLISIPLTFKALEQTFLVTQDDKSHSFLNLLAQAVSDIARFPLSAISASSGLILIPLFFVITNFILKKPMFKKILEATLAIGAFVTFAILLIWQRAFEYSPESGSKIGLTLATLTIFGFLTSTAIDPYLSNQLNEDKVQIDYQYSGNAVVLLSAGIVGFSFSSNNGLLNQSAGIGIIYVALFLRFMLQFGRKHLSQRILAFNLVFLLIICSQVLNGAWQNPYRSVNLSENIYPVVVGGSSKILVSKSRAEEISKVKSISIDIDAKERELYLVDLSPFTTFIPYQLGFKTVETPLITQSSYLKGFAQRNSGPLQAVWILTSDSKESLPPNEFLMELGKSLERDYELAYSLEGNFCRNKPCKLFLWKPVKLE